VPRRIALPRHPTFEETDAGARIGEVSGRLYRGHCSLSARLLRRCGPVSYRAGRARLKFLGQDAGARKSSHPNGASASWISDLIGAPLGRGRGEMGTYCPHGSAR
jgi:hypothetical protein